MAEKFEITETLRKDIRAILRDGADIHMRDCEGYTALTVASRLGLRPVVRLLLDHGANVNTRSYQGTSLCTHLCMHMEHARKENQNMLYAGVLCFMKLIIAHNAIDNPTVYDDYATPSPNAPVDTAVEISSVPHIPEPAHELGSSLLGFELDASSEISELGAEDFTTVFSFLDSQFDWFSLDNNPVSLICHDPVSPIGHNRSATWTPWAREGSVPTEIVQRPPKLFKASSNAIIPPKRRRLEEKGGVTAEEPL